MLPNHWETSWRSVSDCASNLIAKIIWLKNNAKKAITLKTKVTLLDGFGQILLAISPDTPVKALFFCQPGGGNTKDYFNPGRLEGFDYSFAAYVTMVLQ